MNGESEYTAEEAINKLLVESAVNSAKMEVLLREVAKLTAKLDDKPYDELLNKLNKQVVEIAEAIIRSRPKKNFE
jgi:ribosomal protein L12E/L44/L45/RPP1/RPP2